MTFIYPVDGEALMYFEQVGDTVIIRCREKKDATEVQQFVERKTGTGNWLIATNYPKERNGVWEWMLV